MPGTVLTAIAIFAALSVVLASLRNGFYVLHILMVAGGSWLLRGDIPAFSIQAFYIFLLLHLPSINACAFLAYGADKRAAKKGKWRIPEKQLLALALVGGIFGSWAGQKFFRHKTKKQSFRQALWLVFVLQAMLLAGLAVR